MHVASKDSVSDRGGAALEAQLVMWVCLRNYIETHNVIDM